MRLDGGLLATGNVGEGVDADGVVFHSVDGTTWEVVTDDALGGPHGQHIAAVAPGGPGLVAAGTEIHLDPLGREDNDAAVWISPDGRSWERVDDPDLNGDGRQEVHSLITTPVGLVASGWGVDDLDEPENLSDIQVWHSTDGYDWERITAGLRDPDDGQQTAEFNSGHSAVEEHVIVIVGFHQRRGQAFRTPGVWVSRDGSRWEVVTGGPLDEPGRLNAVAASDGRFVAVGADLSDALVLTSAEGVDWSRVARADLTADGVQAMWGITPYGDGFVATGETGEGEGGRVPALWTSNDGFEWTLLDLATIAPPPEGVSRLTLAARTDTGIVVMTDSSRHILIGRSGAG